MREARPYGVPGSRQDEALANVARDAYARAALVLGRPGKPCGCRECFCVLHAYTGACVWCRNGQHAERRRLKLKEDA